MRNKDSSLPCSILVKVPEIMNVRYFESSSVKSNGEGVFSHA